MSVCCGSHYNDIKLYDATLQHYIVNNNIEVVGNITDEARKAIGRELDRFPKSHKYVNLVVVTNDLKHQGLFKGSVIYIKPLPIDELIDVMRHEITHATTRTITESDLYEWVEAYAIRLDYIKLEDPPEDKWGSLPNYEGFPTKYSTRNIWEFICEHVMVYTKDPIAHRRDFPLETALIEKHGLGPSF